MNQTPVKTTIKNKHNVAVSIGDILFMHSPKSEKWPKAFPERSWLFIVNSLNNNSLQGYTVNWKRNGKGTHVARDYDELLPITEIKDQDHGLRHATPEEIAYFFKRAPEYKRYANTDTVSGVNA